MPLLQNISWVALKRLIQTQFPTVNSLSTTELVNWLKRNDADLLLLDARTPAEYEVSHLPGAQRVPEGLLEDPTQLEPLKTKTVVVYCSVGYRSAKLAAKLQHHRVERVFNLEGSIFAWANAGYPIYRGTEPVTQVHPYNAAWGKLLDTEFHSG
jgi:rhodanese-related sulfurtransferase